MIFVFDLFVCHEQESSTALVTYNCYGQEQQRKEMNVSSQNMWATPKYYSFIVMINAKICML